MGIVTIKLPDVGEGVAEAEIVDWSVKAGDSVREDDVIAAVMTDKATVEIPSPVSGIVIWTGADIGQSLPVGGDLARIEVAGKGASPDIAAPVEDDPHKRREAPEEAARSPAIQNAAAIGSPVLARRPARSVGERPLAAPSVRHRALESGIDLRKIQGSGAAGRIVQYDLDAYQTGDGGGPAAGREHSDDVVHEVKVIGLRRKIAERMANAKRRIPHITIVEEVDMTALETLREQLNAERLPDRPKLTVLPFLMAALCKAVKDQPTMNALYDDEAAIVREHTGVHIGIATQTAAGLMVPVIRHCETRSLWSASSELTRIAEAARNNTATREDLSGSTITISSLGPLGAIATTPIINHPEVAIVGVNRMEIRPRWDGAIFVPRKMMNLSSSFDHRAIDGWEAALFVKRLKTLLETPALMFVEM